MEIHPSSPYILLCDFETASRYFAKFSKLGTACHPSTSAPQSAGTTGVNGVEVSLAAAEMFLEPQT